MSRSYYGAVGNGETVALVGPDAAIEWLRVPGPHSFPIFARAVDSHHGGALRLQFRWGDQVLTRVEQALHRYLGRTNILVTSLLLDDLNVTVTDYMPWGKRHLTRRIVLTNLGEERRGVRVGFSLTPSAGPGAPENLRDRVHTAFKGPAMALLSPGESVMTHLVVGYGETPTEALRAWVEAPTDDLEAEGEFWSHWLDQARPVASGDPKLDEAYDRSLLVLKLLCVEKTGLIVPSPTAPWHRRQDWQQESLLIARCLDAAGLHRESRRYRETLRPDPGAIRAEEPADPADASTQIKACLERTTDLGLMAEHFDPATGGYSGNFPQGTCHAEFALLLLELFGGRGEAASPPPA